MSNELKRAVTWDDIMYAIRRMELYAGNMNGGGYVGLALNKVATAFDYASEFGPSRKALAEQGDKQQRVRCSCGWEGWADDLLNDTRTDTKHCPKCQKMVVEQGGERTVRDPGADNGFTDRNGNEVKVGDRVVYFERCGIVRSIAHDGCADVQFPDGHYEDVNWHNLFKDTRLWPAELDCDNCDASEVKPTPPADLVERVKKWRANPDNTTSIVADGPDGLRLQCIASFFRTEDRQAVLSLAVAIEAKDKEIASLTAEIKKLWERDKQHSIERASLAGEIERLTQERDQQKQFAADNQAAWLNRGKEYEKAVERAEQAEELRRLAIEVADKQRQNALVAENKLARVVEALETTFALLDSYVAQFFINKRDVERYNEARATLNSIGTPS